MTNITRIDTAANRHTIEVHSACDLFPVMSVAELRELADDIKQNRLLFPIVLDREGRLVDGRNRLKACDLAGVVPTFVTLPDDIAPYDYVMSANIQRRHLTATERRELIAKVLKARPEKSNLAIAQQTKASDKTVAAVRREMEARSEIPNASTREDSKGRPQPSHKPPVMGASVPSAPAQPSKMADYRIKPQEPRAPVDTVRLLGAHERRRREDIRRMLAASSADAIAEEILAADAHRSDGFALRIANRLKARLTGNRDAEAPTPRTH